MSGTDSPDGAPHEPGPGAPGNQTPPQGQPAQPPQPGQYGQPNQPGQYGQPGQYPPAGGAPYPPQGTPPGAPQGPWAYGQPPGGPPSGGSGSNKVLWIILASIATFMVLAVVLVVVLVVVSNDDDESGGTSGGGAESQPAVVKAYLSAVADGDAKKAISMAAVEPLSKDFLTDEVLAESAKIAKITDIKVGEVANEYTSIVPTSFKLGDETVTQDFLLTKSGDDWKMREAGSELDFSNMRKNTLPMMLNGKEVDVDKVTLFPGAYALTTGSDYITYGTTGEFTVKGSADYLRSSDLIPVLTPDGEKDFVAAVKASTRACLQKHELSPANCPNQAGGSQNYKLDKSSVTWTQRGGTDPFANLKPRLDYESPNIATARPNLQLTVKADCNAPSGTCTLNTYSSKNASVDMLQEPLVVRWVD